MSFPINTAADLEKGNYLINLKYREEERGVEFHHFNRHLRVRKVVK